MNVLLYCSVSCSNLFLMMEIIGSTVTDVKRVFYMTKGGTFPFLKSDGFDLFHKCLCVLDVV